MNFVKRVVRLFRLICRYRSLNTRLAIIIFFSVFVPLIIFMIVFNYYISQNYQEELLANAKSSHAMTASSLSNQFNSYSESLSLLMTDTKVRDLISEKSVYTLNELTDLKIEIYNLIYFIENIQQSSVQLRIYVKDKLSELVDEGNYYSLDDIEGAVWFEKLESSKYRNIWISNEDYDGDLTFLPSYRSDPKSNTISYAIKVVDSNDYSQSSSIIRLDFSKRAIQLALQKSLIMENSATYILDESNNTVVSAAVDRGPDALCFTEVNLSDTIGNWGELKIDGDKYHVLTSEFLVTPWKMITIISSEDLNSVNYEKQLLFYISLLLISSVLIFLSSMMFTRKITNQIGLVASNMKNLCSGNFHLLPLQKNHDELSDLIESYNYMTYELQMLIHSSYESGIRIKNAEFKALQAQINPHFLYNTLDMINYHSYKNQPNIVEDIIFQLTKFYRLSLNQGNDTYQIWREIDLVKSYFSIQNIRYGGKMSLDIDIDPLCLEYTIPKITFQPIVENSILHGILNKEEKKGSVAIIGNISGDLITFVIKDDGAGMSEKDVASLNKASKEAPEANDSGSHYGIVNISERISTFFGPQYHLHFESELGKGTIVTLVIPAKY